MREGAYMREKDLKALYPARQQHPGGVRAWDSDHYGSNFAERDLKRMEKELRENADQDGGADIDLDYDIKDRGESIFFNNRGHERLF